jgi:hypothetical protein
MRMDLKPRFNRTYFRFGDGRTVHITQKRIYPVGIRGQVKYIGISVLEGHFPGLMSIEDMRIFQEKIDLENMTVQLLGDNRP